MSTELRKFSQGIVNFHNVDGLASILGMHPRPDPCQSASWTTAGTWELEMACYKLRKVSSERRSSEAGMSPPYGAPAHAFALQMAQPQAELFKVTPHCLAV